eukprot:3227442-Pyramimonas_sp.AAC.2
MYLSASAPACTSAAKPAVRAASAAAPPLTKASANSARRCRHFCSAAANAARAFSATLSAFPRDASLA